MKKTEKPNLDHIIEDLKGEIEALKSGQATVHQIAIGLRQIKHKLQALASHEAETSAEKA